MKYFKYLLLLTLLGCNHPYPNNDANNPINVCRAQCKGYLTITIRTGAQQNDNLYHCWCDNYSITESCK